MVGVVGVLLFLFVIGPIGLFVVGAAWSALNGWLLSDDADNRAGVEPPVDSTKPV